MRRRHRKAARALGPREKGKPVAERQEFTAATVSTVRLLGDGLLTAREVQALLHIGHSKFYTMIATGQLPRIKLGRAIRVSKRHLAEFLKRNTQGGWAKDE